MAGYTEALASVLYPNTNDESAFYLGGQGISQMRLPQFESPWQNFLAAGLQNLVGLGMKGYGARLTNQANAENAAQMIPQLGNLGVSVTPEIQSGLTSTDPQKRALALALTERQMTAADNKAKNDAEFDMFKRKEDYKSGLDFGKNADAKQAQNRTYENQLANRLEGEEYKNFQTTNRIFGTMVKAATKDDKVSDVTLISGIAKLRDPGSIISPGEYRVNDREAQSWLEKQYGDLRSVVEGKARLSPATRAKMLAAASDFFETARSSYESKADPIAKLAEREGLNPANVVLVPYKQTDYADLFKSVPTEDIIRQAFEQQQIAQQMAQMQPRIEVGPLGATSSETVAVSPLPAALPDQEYKQVGPNTYIRITKGK